MEPEQSFDPSGFAEKWWEFIRALNNLEDHVLCAGGEGFDYDRLTTDSHDSSVEIKGATPQGFQITQKQRELLISCGFQRCWICYEAGGEAYYDFAKTG